MNRDQRFWDRNAARYARSPVADTAAYEVKLQATREYLTPESLVLELGCGTGSTALLHAPHVRHIRAVDFSKEMIGIARGKAREAGIGNVTFEQADVMDMPLDDNAYDMVMAMSILHLLEDPDAALARAFGTLKPGGVLVTSTACIGNVAPFLKPVASLGRAIGLLPRLTMMTGDALVARVAAAGFDIVHRWQPDKGKALFLIARKPDQAESASAG